MHSPSQHFPGPEQTSGIERELKLSLDSTAAEQVRRSRTVRAWKSGRAMTRHLRSVYFDTPDQVLRRSGLALRVRHIGARRIQTLKAAVDGAEGLIARREWECDIAGDQPDPGFIDDLEMRERLVDLLAGRKLLPMFESDIRRTAWQLQPREGARVELALDVGTLTSGEQRQGVHELELELKSGPVASVLDIVADLNRTIPFRFESRSKADRGYALAAGTGPVPVKSKAKAVALAPEMSAQQAFAAIAGTCLLQMEANEPAARAGQDPEGVHQLRVACRRLRSAFTLFRPILPEGQSDLAAEFKWFAGETGAARDWDVFLAETLAPLRASLPEEGALEALQAAGRARREAGYARVRAALADPRYTAAKLALRRWLAERDWHRQMDAEAARLLFSPVTDLADLLLARRARKFRRLGRRHADLALPELHELRIRGKKLRYATEFFAALYPGRRTKAYTAALAKLQDVLGVLNDGVVAGHLVEQAARTQEDGTQDGGAAPWLDRAEGIVAGWYAAHSGLRLGRLSAEWRAFAECKPFWHRQGAK